MNPLVWTQFHNILSLDKKICILARVEVKDTKMRSDNLCLLVKHKLRGLDDGLLRDLSRHFEALQGHIKYVPKLTFDQSEVLAGVNPVSKLLSECYYDIIHAVDNLGFKLIAVILFESIDHLLPELLHLPDG